MKILAKPPVLQTVSCQTEITDTSLRNGLYSSNPPPVPPPVPVGGMEIRTSSIFTSVTPTPFTAPFPVTVAPTSRAPTIFPVAPGVYNPTQGLPSLPPPPANQRNVLTPAQLRKLGQFNIANGDRLANLKRPRVHDESPPVQGATIIPNFAPPTNMGPPPLSGIDKSTFPKTDEELSRATVESLTNAANYLSCSLTSNRYKLINTARIMQKDQTCLKTYVQQIKKLRQEAEANPAKDLPYPRFSPAPNSTVDATEINIPFSPYVVKDSEGNINFHQIAADGRPKGKFGQVLYPSVPTGSPPPLMKGYLGLPPRSSSQTWSPLPKAQYPFRDYPRYGTNQNSPIFQSSSSSDTRSTRSNSDGPTDRSTGKPLDITNNPDQCHECTASWTHADPGCWCQPKLVIDESKDQNTDEQPDRPASQASTVEYSEEIKTEKE